MAVALRSVGDVESLVVRVLRLVGSGLPSETAVERVLAESSLDEETAAVLVRRGLLAAVNQAVATQRRGGPTRLHMLRPADGPNEREFEHGGAVSGADEAPESEQIAGASTEAGTGATARPRSQQVAPGTRPEWDIYLDRFPALASIPFANGKGDTVSMLDFARGDWQTLLDRDESRRRGTVKRIEAERLALRMLTDRKVERTRELPPKDLAALDAAVGEAWRR